jgi:hypothetical protein
MRAGKNDTMVMKCGGAGDILMSVLSAAVGIGQSARRQTNRISPQIQLILNRSALTIWNPSRSSRFWQPRKDCVRCRPIESEG